TLWAYGPLFKNENAFPGYLLLSQSVGYRRNYWRKAISMGGRLMIAYLTPAASLAPYLRILHVPTRF
ncbi:MAG: hypothetical protein SV375_08730, partial [Thermodesulfobacteriota bacterium]|nr:hypothetical protein [Thermodesulfobacteriota bacterium]